MHDEESEVKQAADMLMKAVQNFTGATAGRSGRYGVSDNSSPGRRRWRRRKRLRIQCDDENPYNDAQPGPSGARFGVMTQSGHSSPARSSQLHFATHSHRTSTRGAVNATDDSVSVTAQRQRTQGDQPQTCQPVHIQKFLAMCVYQ